LLRADMVRERLKHVSRPMPQKRRAARALDKPANFSMQDKGFIASMSEEAMSNFTPRAQQVLALARKEADRFNHNFVGTEHLLLGLIKLGQGVAVNVLQKMGLDLETVRMEVEKQVGTGPDQKMIGNIPYTPRVKKVLALAPRKPKTSTTPTSARSTSCSACCAKATAWPRASSRAWTWTSSRPARKF
jgi:hypothetical protein